MPKLNEEQQSALKDLVEKAMKDVRPNITANQEIIADLYTGRDPGGTEHRLPTEGVPWNEIPDLTSGTHSAPDTTANLFLSRLRQIVVSTTPGHPNFEISALVPAAAHLVETQQIITDTLLRHSNIEEAFERAAFLGPTQNYFGIKLIPRLVKDNAIDRLKFETIESEFCGYEPHQRRFTWHTYNKQWGELPKAQRPVIKPGMRKMNDWDMVSVTEVYHEGLSMGKQYEYPMTTFVNLEGKIWERRRKTPRLGDYVGTEGLPAPVLVIDRYLDPAPREDIPPAEVSSWVPLMRQIVQVLVQITREINSTNSEILYDADAIPTDIIDHVRRVQGGKKVYIPVNVNDAQRGVNSTMRPVERNAPLAEYITTLNMLLSLFDDITGVGPLDRGSPSNPEKSATEAAQLSAAADRRNQDRMRVLARMWGNMAELVFRWQRLLYGETLEIPTAEGITRQYLIPNPESARVAFHVNVAELTNKSRSQQMNTLMTAHTLLVNDATSLQDPNAMRMVGESRRRLLKALGWVDVDLYDSAVLGEQGPLERYVEALETGMTLPVYQDDKHDVYIAAYMKILSRAMAAENPDVPVAQLQLAIEEHQLYLQQQQEMLAAQAGQNMSTVPGVSGSGQIDNQVAAQMAAGLTPEQTPQTVQ